MFNPFNRNREVREAAFNLYFAAVRQARLPVFFEQYGVADTPDGRFDIIILHVFLVLRRLKGYDNRCKTTGQAIFDIMFNDMDQNLREMGAGDIGVSYQVKDMAKAFYGRIAAYEKGLDEPRSKWLEAALCRNLYRGTSPKPVLISTMVEYIKRQDKALAMQAIDSLLAGCVDFSSPPVIGDMYERQRDEFT